MRITNDMYCMYIRATNLRLQHYVLALQCRDNKVMYIIFDNEIRNLSKTLSTTKCTTRTRYQDTNKVYTLLVSWSAFLVVNLAVNLHIVSSVQ